MTPVSPDLDLQGRLTAPPWYRDTFSRVYPELRRFAAAVCDDDMEPDDILQDALAATLRAELAGSAVQDRPAYIKTAIVSKVRERRREHARSRARTQLVHEERSVVDEYPSELVALLSMLPPRSRALLFLTVIEDMTSSEAAQCIGISAVAARVDLFRARRRLAAELRGGVDA